MAQTTSMLVALPAIALILGCDGSAGQPVMIAPGTQSPPTSSAATPSTTTTPSAGTTSGATTLPTDCTTSQPLAAPTPTTAGPWIHDDAQSRFVAQGPGQSGGLEAGFAGDLNADGHDDLLLASELSSPNGDNAGTAWLFYGPVGTGDIQLTCADLVIQGEHADDRLGNKVAGVRDVTGDGIADLAVAAYRAEAVYVFEADTPGSVAPTDAHARLIAPNGSMTGYGGLTSGDLTGDGSPDLLISSGQPFASGALAWIAPGPIAGDIPLAAALRFTDPSSEHAGDLGVAVADWTGDGLDDAVLALGASGSGARVYAGPIVADLDANAYDARVFDLADTYMHHAAAAGDVDGDGAHDLLLCGAYDDTLALRAGRCAVVSGPIVGEQDVTAFPGVIGETGDGYLGESLAAGDFDGDGFSDVVVAQSERGLYPRFGATFLFLGPVSGQRPASDADFAWFGAFELQMVGSALADVGDVDGDGVNNLVVGATGDTGPAPADVGSWYLLDPAAL